MIRLSYLYYRNVLKGHLWRLLSIELFFAVVVSMIFHDYSQRGLFIGRSLLLDTLGKTVATYATGGLAASFTVTTLLVRIVGVNFAEQVSARVDSVNGLVFRLSLTAVSSWMMLLASSICIFLVPPEVNVFDPAASGVTRNVASFLVGGFVYVILGYLGVLQLLGILAVERVKHGRN